MDVHYSPLPEVDHAIHPPFWTNLAHGEVPHSGNSGSQIPCDGHDTVSMFSLVHDLCVTKNRLRHHSTVPLVRPILNDLDAMSDSPFDTIHKANSHEQVRRLFVIDIDMCPFVWVTPTEQTPDYDTKYRSTVNLTNSITLDTVQTE